MSRETDLSTYDYELPKDLIAQAPAHPRDSARLLVLDRTAQKWEHRTFRDLPDYYDSRDVLVVNNTRVFKARLLGRRILQTDEREGGKVEFLMLERLGSRVWEGLMHASARHQAGFRFRVPTPEGGWVMGEIVRGSRESPNRTVAVEFDRDPLEAGAGEVPLPPYIARDEQAEDLENYQTLYAKHLGSAAAPTAGLHFTGKVMAKLKENGADWQELTLNVGLGTFRPVQSADIRRHQMHEEKYEISEQTAENLNRALQSGKRITAVGTTSTRTLESAWTKEGVRAGSGRTSLFIYPKGQEFHVTERMITCFHLPQSTLLMLVCAFAGIDFVLAAYREAVKEEYRFFSYGDAMLIL